jgi:hypothetical protein
LFFLWCLKCDFSNEIIRLNDMKNFLYTLIANLLCLSSQSADLVVEEFGVLPSHPSISSAVAAASDGDRIVIKNRAGEIPWIENITIDKSLTFVCYSNNTPFIVQGDYSIVGSDDRDIIIVGMKNTAGSILISSSSSVSRGTRISIMDSWFNAGSILLDDLNFDAQIISNRLDFGQVRIKFGNIIGNEITSDLNAIYILNENSDFSDTTFVIGNKVVTSNVGGASINLDCNTMTLHVKNNFVKTTGLGITLTHGNSNGNINQIWNNTIVIQGTSGSQFGIEMHATTEGSAWEIMNNVIDENANGVIFGIAHIGGLGQVNAYYNYVDYSFDYYVYGDYTLNENNVDYENLVVNADGTLEAGNPAIDGANPGLMYYDLDLTEGDAGAHGGSYTLDNFFPLFTGSARVYFIDFPFNVRQGSTLNIKAFGFDR